MEIIKKLSGRSEAAHLVEALFRTLLSSDRDDEMLRRAAGLPEEPWVNTFFGTFPIIAAELEQDLQAALDGDPAANSREEIILCYPGFFALAVYRMAHRLHCMGVPLLPRAMTEYAHSRTGIDIHPGARIAPGCFIDHGTGVVIGETTVIGTGAKLYQGVTLGGLSTAGDLRGKKRHPTLEDHVTVYANATILGGETVIGRGSVIGAGAFVTSSLPPGSRARFRP